MLKLLAYLVIGVLALYLATLLVPGVMVEDGFEGQLKVLAASGIALGLANYFLKPIVSIITAPLLVLTFGVFGVIINMLMVWLVDILFPKLIILGFWPLFWTGLLAWVLNFLFLRIAKKIF